jgi:hypothetical protein
MSSNEIQTMLDELRVELPRDIQRAELIGYAAKVECPLGTGLEGERFRYFLLSVPLNVLVPDMYRLVRLRLRLELEAEGAVAYDLFPQDQWSTGETSLGEASVDVSKLLKFVCPPAADCLGLKLGFPIKWKTTSVRIRTSDRMSNPVEWYLTDDAMQHGFAGYAIVRAPANTPVEVRATLACEVRRAGVLGHFTSARLQSAKHSYTLAGA